MPQNIATALLSPEMMAQLERLELVTRKIFRGRTKGDRRSKKKGQSVEFADFRNYVPGDDLRFLDWNLYARLDRLFLKLFLEEEDLRFYVLLDASESMNFGTPTKLEYAKQLAAALGFVGLIRSDRVKIETFGQPLSRPSPAWRGRSQLWRMLEQLGSIEDGENVPLATAIKNFCLRNPGQGIVVLLSDMMDKQGYEPALRYLLSQHLDVYLVQILCEEETNPEIKGDLRLVDCEDQDIAEITVSVPLLKRYQMTLSNFVDAVRDYCTRRGMTHLLATTNLPVDQMVLHYLRRRGLLR